MNWAARFGYGSDLATIATAAVAIWFWWTNRAAKQHRQSLLEKIILNKHKKETSPANDARSLTLQQLASASGFAPDQIRDL